MKVCPKCGKKWPDTGKFCPMDGTPLVAEVEEEPDARPTRILGPDELPKVAAEARPVKSPAPAAGPTPPPTREPPPAKPSEPATKPATPPPKSPAPAAKPAPPPPDETPPAEPDRPGTFSETKWFLVGEHIKDEEIEASDLPVEDLQEIYKRTGTLPEEVRKKYSLRYGTDEERSQGRGSRKKK